MLVWRSDDGVVVMRHRGEPYVCIKAINSAGKINVLKVEGEFVRYFIRKKGDFFMQLFPDSPILRRLKQEDTGLYLCFARCIQQVVFSCCWCTKAETRCSTNELGTNQDTVVNRAFPTSLFLRFSYFWDDFPRQVVRQLVKI